jgi:spore coat polysaccharide biosynthesis protein SpsF (cytidylyltransferase family)
LKRAAVKKVLEIKQATDTECWGKYFTETGLFRWGQIDLFADYPHLKDFRVTIDYPEDYEFFKRLYTDLLTEHGAAFTVTDLIRTLDKPRYLQELSWMRRLNTQWLQHFSSSQEPVSRDVQRIVAAFEGKF